MKNLLINRALAAKKKKLFSLFLALIASVGTMFSLNYERVQIGDLYYNLNQTNKMAEVTYKRYDGWHTYNEGWTITTANIPSSVKYNSVTYSVTSIGDNAFNGCSGLTSITIPNSVTRIGSNAFYNCSGLTSVTIPNSVTSIGDYVFENCTGLTSVTIGNSVPSIGNWAFSGCSGLTSVTIPNSVISIGSWAFSGCSGLTSVTIPNSVISIGDYVFDGCTGLTSITIPNSVTSIGSNAFYNCSGLTSVTIPNSVISIGDHVFENCTGLTSVTIGYSVTSIGSKAFSGCSGLTSVTIPNSVTSIRWKAFENCSGLTSVTIPNSVTGIGDSAFSGCTGLTSVTIPNSVISIGDYVFENCTGLTSVNVDASNPNYSSIDGVLFNKDRTELILYPAEKKGAYSIPNSVISIKNKAFANCTGLTSVTIPNSVTSIGDSAFSGCTGLTSVTIGNSVTSIGNSAFYGCTGLISILIPNVTSIGSSAFSNCSSLASVTISGGITKLSDELFYGCINLTSITLPDGITSIGYWAFRDCSSLSSIRIPNNVTLISYGAFYGCSGLISVSIPNGVTALSNELFRNCSSLTYVTIPNSVTSIGDEAFCYCRSLTSVTIGNSVTSIGYDAFRGCFKLTSVTINSNAIVSNSYDKSFGIGSIFGSQVTEYVIGDSVTAIGTYAFSGFLSPYGDCKNLASVTIGKNVTSIGDYAFYQCESLTSVTINSNTIASKRYTDSESLIDIFGRQVLEFVIGDCVTSIGGYAFYNKDYGAIFNSCLKSVTIGKNVTSIGDEAFYNCNRLTSVHISDLAAWCAISFGSNPLDYAHNLYLNGELVTDLVIPDSVTSIGDDAFRNCTSLTSVTIGNNVISIGNYAFADCGSLTSPVYNAHVFAFMPTSYSGAYTIPNGIESIAGGAFSSCTGLTSVTIPNSVTSIGDYAFNCTGLTSVTIPNSVTSIGDYAFRGCSTLRYIYMIAQTPPSIGSYSFPLDGSPNDITKKIFVPCNSADDYKVAWSDYADYIYAICSSYTINFVNWDGSNLQASQVTYGDMPQYTGATPTKPSDSQYTYTFAGWTPDIGPAVRSTTYKATFTAEPKSGLSYTITFVNWDGSNLQTLDITEGDMPQYTGATPTKPSDSQYSYTFSGWTPQIVAATADATYTATFTATEIPSEECTDVNATWLQTGGSGLGEMITNDSTVWFYDAQYGAKASKQGGYTGYLMTPAKDLRGMKSVTLSFMHTHKFAGTPSNELTLWVTPDYKGSVEASQWQQLTIAPYAANTNWTFVSVSINVPVSEVGANTVFAFKYMSTASNYSTWEIKNLTLIAECEGSTPPQPTYYTIKFKNWDGSVLQSTQVEEGQMPQYTGATPTKPDDSQYTYTFSGWTPQIVAATADATYTATFAATKLPIEECGVNAMWLQTGGSGLGEITTDNSGVWKYEYQYGACAKANSGEIGWLLTPAKDLSGMKSVNLSFLHVHKNAGIFTDEMTLWVCANYKGSVSASQWQQLTISPYSANNDWVYVNVSIDVPLNMVGANTVFGFKYTSSNNSAIWEIKELNLNAECAKADETTTTDVTATPNEDNSVTLTWPAVNGADTYTIEIKKNGVLVCTLVFNANGQLISINFAAPARDGQGRNVPAAEQSAKGWTYIVTGLEGNASYTYSVTAKDVNGNVLLKQSVDFSMGEEPTSIEDIQGNNVQCTKVIREGQIFILRGEKVYSLTGQEVR